MFKCPNCHKPGIPILKKTFMGPAAPTKCKRCGKKVGVSYYSLLTMIPFFFALVLYDATELNLLGLIYILILILIIYTIFMPLTSKE